MRRGLFRHTLAGTEDCIPDLEARALTSDIARLSAGIGLRCELQPILDLDSREVVGFEALARGPHGTELESPAALFAEAGRAGLELELDLACAKRAMQAAREAAIEAPLTLFVNLEPEQIATREGLASELRGEAEGLRVVIEVTERALTRRPESLLRGLAELRDAGFGIALDDVGADPRALPLLSILRPDVIKLDLSLVREQPSRELAEIVNAVNAEAELSGSTILAEGIETEDHLFTAAALGATLGQGFLLGRPGPPPSVPPSTRIEVPLSWRPGELDGETPFDVISGRRPLRPANRDLLLRMSRNLERQALTLGPSGLILSTFQYADRYSGLTEDLYAKLGERASVITFGVGLDHEVAPGVGGIDLDPGDPLVQQWCVCVVGAHFAAAFAAREIPHEGAQRDRRFDFAMTYSRELAIEMARSLVLRVPDADAANPDLLRGG